MALTPPPPFVIADYTGITDWSDRGGIFFSESTTSQRAKPSGYVVKDVCGADAYVKGGMSVNVAKLVNCSPIAVATVSIKGTFAIGTAATDMEALFDQTADILVPFLAAI